MTLKRILSPNDRVSQRSGSLYFPVTEQRHCCGFKKNMPEEIRQSESVSSFKSLPKTYLFWKAYPDFNRAAYLFYWCLIGFYFPVFIFLIFNFCLFFYFFHLFW